MTPAARLQAAIEIGAEIDASSRAAAVLIEGAFRRRRYMGSGDRRAVSDRIYGFLRRRARLEWRGGTTPRRRLLADLVLTDGLPEESVSGLVAGVGHGPEPLTSDESAWLDGLYGQALDHPDMPDWVRYEYPAWLDGAFRAAFGDAFAAEMTALNQQAALDLRVNTARVNREEAARALATDGLDVEPTPLSSVGLRCNGRARLGHVGAFRNGWIEIQDEGSQIAAATVGAEPGMTVVDFCAGGGGKTLALADAMTRAGRIDGELWACDADGRRLKGLNERLQRSRLGPVRIHVLGSLPDVVADRVLVDAPCTGTGTWRRRPEAKWRLTPNDLETRIAEQARILASASDLVRPGGRLVYVTCSVLCPENEDQIGRFVESRPDFTLTTAPIRLSPARNGTDGFFVAVLERRI